MGQAFDENGNVLGEATGNTKQEVFEKLNAEFKDATEIRIRQMEDKAREVEQSSTSDQGDGATKEPTTEAPTGTPV